jgi:repressor LexA
VRDIFKEKYTRAEGKKGKKVKIGDYVKQYRAENRLTMQEFADKAGLSKGYISMLEKGRNPQNSRSLVRGIDTVAKIAQAMNISIDELLAAVDSDQLITPKHNNDTKLKLYENIRERRKELGLTQSDLAHKVGYSDKSMIAKIENGKVDLGQSKILEIAKALQISPSELTGWEDTSTKLNPIDLSDFDLVAVPVFGSIPPGVPLEQIECIEDDPLYVEKKLCKGGQVVKGLRVHGDSMAPKIMDNDRVVFRVQPECETGDIVVARIDGNSATLKKAVISERPYTFTLQPINAAYEPIVFTGDDSEPSLEIIGVVIQLVRDI